MWTFQQLNEQGHVLNKVSLISIELRIISVKREGRKKERKKERERERGKGDKWLINKR